MSHLEESTIVRAPSKWVTRRRFAWACFAAGLLIFAYGCFLETRNPRTNIEDDFAWVVLGIGVSLGTFGLALRFLHPVVAILFAVFAPYIAFNLAVVMYWSVVFHEASKNSHHQEFAVNGISQIAPAQQMADLYPNCRHFITYGAHDVPLFNSVAYFGDRYELSMQVPVKIESKSLGSMVGDPQFYLLEVSSVKVQATGQISTSFSSDLKFGVVDWEKVYQAKGDFNAIGFRVDPTPVAGFKKFADASRQSN